MKYSTLNHQHTCKSATAAYLLKNAPFKSEKYFKHDLKSGKKRTVLPFLGEGYYFWEENINEAHSWGVSHYKGNYAIVNYKNISIDVAFLLDLTDRRVINDFEKQKAVFLDRFPERVNWNVAQWIELFKEIRRRNNNMDSFAFNYIKIERSSAHDMQDICSYKLIRPYYININPIYILCICDKSLLKCEIDEVIHNTNQ